MVDYKSQELVAELPGSEFLLQEAIQYRDKLANYKKVVVALDQQSPVLTALYIPLLAHIYPLNAWKFSRILTLSTFIGFAWNLNYHEAK